MTSFVLIKWLRACSQKQFSERKPLPRQSSIVKYSHLYLVFRVFCDFCVTFKKI